MWMRVESVSASPSSWSSPRPLCRREESVPPAAAVTMWSGASPVELLDDLEGRRLGALRVERPQRDVRELHAGRFGHFAAAAIDFVVVALDLADLRSERAAGAGLHVLQAVGIEDVRRDPRLGGQRGHGRADVARGDAADLLPAELEQPGDRHRDDAVLVGEAGAGGRVVLQVEVRSGPARRRAGRRGSGGCSRRSGPTRACAEASTIGRSSSKRQMFSGRCAWGTSSKRRAASS